MESLLEQTQPALEGTKNKADSTTKEQTEPGGSMGACQGDAAGDTEIVPDEHSTAAQTMEIVAKQGHWMLKIPPRCGVERGKWSTG